MYKREITESYSAANFFAEAKELEKQKKIIHFEIGQPDFQPPRIVLEATSRAVLTGSTSYTVSRGIIELRESVSGYLKTYNRQLEPTKNICITSGAKFGIYALISTIITPKANIIVFEPAWGVYQQIIESFGGECRNVPINADNKFDHDYLMSRIDFNTKAIIINSPSNPTGSILSKEELTVLYKICRDHEILLISDEIYNEYVYEGSRFNSLLSIKDSLDYGVVINGFSKTFSMTGFRLGYAVGNSSIISKIDRAIQISSTCPVNFVQKAGIIALQNIDAMRQYINKIMPPRRELACELMENLPIEHNRPKGGIYVWVKIPEMSNSVSWARELLHKEGVAIMPGRIFGKSGEGYIRLSFALDEEIISEGIKKISNYLI